MEWKKGLGLDIKMAPVPDSATSGYSALDKPLLPKPCRKQLVKDSNGWAPMPHHQWVDPRCIMKNHAYKRLFYPSQWKSPAARAKTVFKSFAPRASSHPIWKALYPWNSSSSFSAHLHGTSGSHQLIYCRCHSYEPDICPFLCGLFYLAYSIQGCSRHHCFVSQKAL